MTGARLIRRAAPLAMTIALTLGAPLQAFAANFEAVLLPPNGQFGANFFRVNVTTGQIQWGVGGGAAYTIATEPGPLPTGDYHLYIAYLPPAPGANLGWSIIRMDAKSGRTWSLVGGGPNPFSMVELVAK